MENPQFWRAVVFGLLCATAPVRAGFSISEVDRAENGNSIEPLLDLQPGAISGGNSVYKADAREGQFYTRQVIYLNGAQAIAGGGSDFTLPPGNSAPGTTSTFSTFLPEIFVNASGQIAFAGTTVESSSRAYWAGVAPGSLIRFAGADVAAPGTNGTFTFSSGGGVTGFNDAGEVALGAGIAGAPNGTDFGLWVGLPGDLQLVARTGSQAPDYPDGVTWSTLGEMSLNAAGQVAFNGYVSQQSLPETGVINGGVIAMGDADSLQIVARTGDRAPGTEESVYLDLQDAPLLNANGEIVFRARLVENGAVIGSGGAIYAGAPDQLQLIARTKFPAPGVEADAKFSDLDKPVINAAGEVAFTCYMTSSSRPSGKGVWAGSAGRLRLIARTGDLAPGVGGLVFSDFPQNGLLLSDSGQIAFLASYGTGLFNSSGSGLFATDKTGALQLIARVGTPINGTAVDGIQLASNPTLSGSGDGRRTSLDTQGRLLFYASTNATENTSPKQALYQVTFDESLPVIPTLGQPASVRAVVGGTATFRVDALGSRPATFQWKHNGDDLDGETSDTLTIENLTEDDRGAYTVVVTNSVNSVTSAAAQLTFPPVITSQPRSRPFNAGTTAALQVTATGPGTLTYQWQSKLGAASDFTDVGSATQATLSLPNVAANQAGKYRVIITNADGSTTSAEATLTVAAAGAALVTQVLTPGDPADGVSPRHVFAAAEDPVLNNAGEIAFEGRLLNEGNSGGAYLRQVDGSYSFLVYQGFNLSLSDSGETVMTAGNYGGRRGFVVGAPGTPGTVQPLALTQTPSPIAGVNFSDDYRYAIDDDGNVVFRYGLGTSVGIFLGRPADLSLLARTNFAAPGLSGVVFSALADPVINPGGKAAFFATLSGTGITDANNTSIWAGDAAGMERIVAEGDNVTAAGSGVKIGEILYPSSDTSPFGWNAAGQVAFQTELTGTGITSANDTAILAGTPGNLAVVARDGVSNGYTFSLNQSAFPVINKVGQVAFVASVTPTGGGQARESVWLWTPGQSGGTRQLIALEGQQVPGLATGITFASNLSGNKPYFSCALNGAGQLIISSRIAGPGISFDNKNDVVIMLTLPTGEMKLVVRTGSGIDTGAGVMRTPRELLVALRSGGEDGLPRSISEEGEIVFSAALEPAGGGFNYDYTLFTARLPGTGATEPSVTTQTPTNVTETGATLRASVNPNGGATTVHFEYGPDTNYGQTTATQLITAGTSPSAVTATIAGLTANASYHYRAVATNSAGTVNGADISFTAVSGGTGGEEPVATIAAATSITDTGATLNGSIDRKGESVISYFEYGTTTAYGQRTPDRISFPGTSAYPVSEAITGLTTKTTYHYRLVVSSANGSDTSDDRTFSTRGAPGDFTIEITDLDEDQVVSPTAKLVASAAVKIPRGSKTRIASVQFYVDGVLASTDLKSAYKIDTTVSTPGQHALSAVGVDTNGKEVESAPVHFTVAEVGAGPLALSSSLSPDAATAKPGDLLTYTLFARNSTNTGVKNVELTLLVPIGSGYVETRFVDANGQPLAKLPKGATISFNGSNGTVTVKLKTVNAFTSFGVQLLSRIPYDQVTVGNVIASSAFEIKATQVRTNYTANFPTRNITVTGAIAGGAARPSLGVFVTQTAAGELPADPSIVTVTTAGLGVPGSKPKRLSNEITYSVTFCNYGDAPAHSVRVVVPVPVGTTYKNKSAKVIAASGDDIRVSAPGVFGNLLFFDVPSLEDGYFTGNPGSSKTLTYTVRVDKNLPIGRATGEDDIVHEGAGVSSGELLRPVANNARKLARVLVPTQMTHSFTRQYVKAANEPADSSGGTVYHTIFYQNQGAVSAKKVGIRYTIPAGLAIQSASFADHLGNPIPKAKTQAISTFAVGATSGDVTFDIGTVGSNKRGAVQIALTLSPGTRPSTVRKTQSVYHVYDSSTLPPPANGAAAALRLVGPPLQNSLTAFIAQQAYDATLSRIFVMQAAPASVAQDGEFDLLLTWGNLSDGSSGSGGIVFPIPAGLELVSASPSTASFNNQSINAAINLTPDTQYPNGRVAWTLGPLGHSVLTAKIRLRAKTGVTGEIQIAGANAGFDLSIGPIFAGPLAIQVIPEGETAETYKAEIHNSSMGQGGGAAVGTAAAPSQKFVNNVQLIKTDSRVISIAGADYATLSADNSVVIPLGGNRMVAAGGGNLVEQVSANMVAAGGGNLVAAGGGNMQINVSGSGQFTSAQLISNGPSLVAAGGMNMVAAGGLNLLRKTAGVVGGNGASLIGMDGSTLIGLDGSTLGAFRQKAGFVTTFKPIAGAEFNITANAAGMVAAGGGNLRIAGGGHLVAAGGGNVIPPAALVGNDGASLIGLDGSTLIGLDGSTLIGNDGSTMVAAGGGNFVTGTTGMVAAGGLNNH